MNRDKQLKRQKYLEKRFHGKPVKRKAGRPTKNQITDSLDADDIYLERLSIKLNGTEFNLLLPIRHSRNENRYEYECVAEGLETKVSGPDAEKVNAHLMKIIHRKLLTLSANSSLIDHPKPELLIAQCIMR